MVRAISIMKISIITTMTNPFSLNYFTYIATLESWAAVVDEIIVVDGGTTDISYDLLSDNVKDKLHVVANDVTRWSLSEDFSPNHINSMLNEGIRVCTGDFAFLIGADFVLYSNDRDAIFNELSVYKDESWLRFSRYKYVLNLDNAVKVSDNRGAVVLNMNKMRTISNFPYIMGISSESNIIYDYPIEAVDYCGFLLNNASNVIVPRGNLLRGGNITMSSIRVFVPDHFFYTIELATFQRMRFFEYFNSRAIGSAKISKLESLFMNNKSLFGSYPLDCYINLDIPADFKSIINMFFESNMIGLKYSSHVYLYFLKPFFRVYRIIKTTILRLLGLRGIFEEVYWSKDRSEIKYFDMREFYQRQNKYFKFII